MDDLTAEQRAARERTGSPRPQLSDFLPPTTMEAAPVESPRPQLTSVDDSTRPAVASNDGVRIAHKGDSLLTAEQRAARDRIASPGPSLEDFLHGLAGPHEVANTKPAPPPAVFPTMPTQPKPEAGGSFLPPTGAGGGRGGGAVSVALTDPENVRRLQRLQNQQAGIAHEQGDALADKELAQAGEEENTQHAIDQEYRRQQDVARDRAMQGAAFLQQAKQDYEDLKKQPDVDPDRWWNSKSTGSQVGLAIAAALSGFANGWNHIQGENPVVKSIMDHTAMDIQAQRDAFNRKKDMADRRNSLFAQMYALTGDENEAMARAFNVALEGHVHALNAAAERANSPVFKANADAAANQIRQAQVMTGIKYYKYMAAGAGGGYPTAKDISEARGHYIDMALQNGHVPTTEEIDKEVAAKFGLYQGQLAEIGRAPKGEKGAAMKQAQNDIYQTLSADPQHGTARWNPLRNIQGTDANARVQNADEWNAGVLATIHASNTAIRSQHGLEMAGKAYLIKPGDTPGHAQKAMDDFMRHYGGMAYDTPEDALDVLRQSGFSLNEEPSEEEGDKEE